MDNLWKKAPNRALITGIGSLPHACVDSALQYSFKMPVPFVPQIPIRNPKEYMVGQALEGFPGLVTEAGGFVTVDLEKWKARTEEIRSRTESAFRSEDPKAFESFEPSSEMWSCWGPFLWELEERNISFAKLQIAGPMTCQWAMRAQAGQDNEASPELGMQVFRLILARAIAMSRRLNSIGVTPLFFLDEPGFYGFSSKNPHHLIALQELKLFIQTLKKEQTLVGIHCCSNTDWKALLSLPIDVLSIDTTLSLDHLMTCSAEVDAFLKRGGRLSLGVIPTGGQNVTIRGIEPELLLEKLKETMSHHWDSEAQMRILSQALFTPACGLALHSIEDAEAILGQLMKFSKLLG